MSRHWNIIFNIFIIFLNRTLALSDETMELIQMLHNTCVEDSGVDKGLIVKVNKEKVFTDNENLKCYMKCLMAQMSCIDDDGIIDVEATIALLPDDIRDGFAPTIRACGTKIGTNPCDNAWLTNQCYAENYPDGYMLI